VVGFMDDVMIAGKKENIQSSRTISNNDSG
jgi:predicted acetyltransferase